MVSDQGTCEPFNRRLTYEPQMRRARVGRRLQGGNKRGGPGSHSRVRAAGIDRSDKSGTARSKFGGRARPTEAAAVLPIVLQAELADHTVQVAGQRGKIL